MICISSSLISAQKATFARRITLYAASNHSTSLVGSLSAYQSFIASSKTSLYSSSGFSVNLLSI